MTLFLLYLWLKLDEFAVLLGLLTFFSLFIPLLGIAICAGSMDGFIRPETRAKWEAGRNRWFSAGKIVWPISLFLFCIWVALPTQRQGAYLIAGYAGLKLAETPEMSKLTELVRLKVGNYLDDELAVAKAEAQKAVASAVGK